MQPSFFFVWRLGGSYGLKVLLESLFSSFDFKKKQKEDRACASLALSRRSPHEEEEPGTGKRRGCPWVFRLFLIFGTISCAKITPRLSMDLIHCIDRWHRTFLTLCQTFC
jgi:hypothetical protein